MKKSFIVISAFCLAMGTTGYAQTGLQVGLRFNPEFTFLLNKNDADAGDELDYTSHFGYLSFGIGALYNVNNNIGFGIDILFSREGQAFKGNFSGGTVDTTAYSAVVVKQEFLNDTILTGDYDALAELNYIKLPLMLSLTSDNTKPVFFTLLAGPQFNFLEGVAQEVNGEDLEYPNTNIEPKDLYKPVVFSGVLAVGGAYNLTSGLVLSARLRFDYGFNDVEKKDVKVSYLGGDPVLFYSTDRKSTHNLTAGLMISLDFKL
ncbi:MAG TPA: outer membrane beta-barrel protein [Chitinophagales bacterium]|nr:outer membrane beta-barrel protein [Chitinophagales bacterium]